MSSIPMSAPVQPLFPGEKFVYWSSTPELTLTGTSAAGHYNTSIQISTACPSTSGGWAGSATSPLIPNWYHTIVTKVIITAIIQPVASLTNDDMYVCWRPSAISTGLPAATVTPSGLLSTDTRWRYKLFRQTADARAQKFRIVIRPSTQLLNDTANRQFAMPSAVGAGDGTIPIEGTWVHIVFGQNNKDAATNPIQAIKWQAHYKLLNWERRSGVF